MLAVRCTLLRDAFEGGRPDNPREAEWPPAWMRLFSALVAYARDGADDAVLARLEREDPPDILAPRLTITARPRSAFVPTNATGPTRHGTLPARTNSVRQWARIVPQSPSWWYVWPDLALSDEERAALGRLCRRVPYLGRSTSPAVVTLDEVPPAAGVEASDDAGMLARWQPRGRVPEGTRFRPVHRVRCAFPGALQALRDAYEANARSGETAYVFEIGRTIDYGQPGDPVEPEATRGPYRDLIVFRLEGRVLDRGARHRREEDGVRGRRRLDGRHTARVTHAFRRAVLSRANGGPPSLHGHHDGDVVQCAFLGLPDVGHPRADGHLLGLAVAIPDMPADELATINATLSGDEIEVTAGALGRLVLRRVAPIDAARMPVGLQPWRWAGPSRVWLTALPMVCDRFLHPGDDTGQELRRAIANSRLPDPVEVRYQRRPLVPGGLDLAPRDTVRRKGDRGFRPYRHARVEFAEPVAGPVVLGSMRHYGLGLCVPLREEQEPQGQEQEPQGEEPASQEGDRDD